LPGTHALDAEVLGTAAVSASWRLGDGSHLRIDLNLSAKPIRHTPPVNASLLFEQPPGSGQQLDQGTLPPYCALVSLTAAAPLLPLDGERQ
jgi:maltooligosyltrehalose trehalohydrolase